MTETVATSRPEFPHLENLDRVLVHRPDFLDRAVSVSEKLHGFNARVGRDRDGTLWFGTRTQSYDLDSPAAPATQGLRDYARVTFRYLPNDVTVYGEWAGRGVMRGIDYGPQRFYLFAERIGDGPVMTSQVVLDQHMHLGVSTVPVIYEGVGTRLDVLDELRQGGSIVAPGQPIEGVVISPLEPVLNVYGGQVIAKFKSDRFSELTNVVKERKTVDMSRVGSFAEKYVNPERLSHVLEQVVEANPLELDMDVLDPVWTGQVLKAMYVDVAREGRDDLERLTAEDQKIVGKAVNKETLRFLAAARDDELREALVIGGQDGE